MLSFRASCTAVCGAGQRLWGSAAGFRSELGGAVESV